MLVLDSVRDCTCMHTCVCHEHACALRLVSCSKVRQSGLHNSNQTIMSHIEIVRPRFRKSRAFRAVKLYKEVAITFFGGDLSYLAWGFCLSNPCFIPTIAQLSHTLYRIAADCKGSAHIESGSSLRCCPDVAWGLLLGEMK